MNERKMELLSPWRCTVLRRHNLAVIQGHLGAFKFLKELLKSDMYETPHFRGERQMGDNVRIKILAHHNTLGEINNKYNKYLIYFFFCNSSCISFTWSRRKANVQINNWKYSAFQGVMYQNNNLIHERESKCLLITVITNSVSPEINRAAMLQQNTNVQWSVL